MYVNSYDREIKKENEMKNIYGCDILVVVISMNYLTLVNKSNLIKDSYFKNLELVDYKDILEEDIKVEKKTLDAYLKLKEFLKTKNIYIEMDSSYRTIEEQQSIINEYTIKYGDAYVEKYVAPIRTSEHHTGLAVDLALVVDGEKIIENEDLMNEANGNIYLEIHKYLKDFGFILRYPKGKEKITGYNYEPWHIRYVGLVPATIIYNNNLTLEEYLNEFSGVLVINKEKNMTSRDVVNKVSKILGIKKIGHTGTLDPLAEGVLVLTIGKATKIGELLTSYNKEYIATVEVGKLTDTLDITGNTLKEKELSKEIDYKKLCKSFEKKYMQEVPIYSAVKVNGMKLYDYARNGIEVVLPKKEVEISNIELLSSNNNSFSFKCLVSKGTYIRSLIRDMGLSVDEYFTMTDLIRTKQGDFSIDDAYTIKDIEDNNFKILKIEETLKYPIIELDEDYYKKISNGTKINNIYNIEDKVIFKYRNKLLAIYEKKDNYLISFRNFT